MLISIIITVYNIEKYLEECIVSVCNQTYENIEIILVNDGSTDGSWDICKKYNYLDKRVHIIEKENGGTVSARKVGVEKACGEYILYIDGDDWIEPDFVEKLAKKTTKNVDIVLSLGCYREYPDNRTIEIKNSLKEEYIKKDFFEEKIFPYFICEDEFYSSHIPVALCFHLFKREFYINIQQSVSNQISIGEDMSCLFRCLLHAESIAILDYSGYHYRQHENSVTHVFTEKKQQSLSLLYRETKNEILNSEYNHEMLLRKLNYWMYFAFMTTDVKRLWKNNANYLFPYTTVKKGSRILIYGAGIFGQQIITALKDNPDYNVVGWLDKGWESYSKSGLDVLPPASALKIDFDYIIISVTRKLIVTQIENELIEMGIPKQKIAEFDLSVLTAENLPL